MSPSCPYEQPKACFVARFCLFEAQGHFIEARFARLTTLNPRAYQFLASTTSPLQKKTSVDA